jgi:WhiB family transcriptional regulator, redox-sensing transcriptional regulator
MHEPAFTTTYQPGTAYQPGTTGLPGITGQPGTTGLRGTPGEADWRELSACRQEDPELFFPLVPAGPGLAQIERAKAVCGRCQVRAECLRFAIETAQDHGVWGGTSEEERRVLRGARRPPAHAAGRRGRDSDRMAPAGSAARHR